MKTIRALILLTAPISVLGGCSEAPAPGAVELQKKLIVAEARANAAEKRAKNALSLATQHAQEPVKSPPPPVEPAQGDAEFGQPVNDTAPIEPVPSNPTP